MPRPTRSPDVDRDLARPALQPARGRRTPENALTGQMLHRQLGHHGHHGARDVQNAALVAQHRRRHPRRRPDADARAGQQARSATSGTKTSTTASGRRACSISRRPRRPPSSLRRLRHERHDRHRDPPSDRCTSAPSGALVFGAGTVQWAWGLDDANDASGPQAPDRNMQQATVNLFADMGAQPATLMSGLSPRRASTDTTAPDSTITSPAPARPSRTAPRSRSPGPRRMPAAAVAGVEVSTDGGTTWHPRHGHESWTYSWIAHGDPTATIRSRAVDDTRQPRDAGAGVTGERHLPVLDLGHECHARPEWTPGRRTRVEVGVKFTTERRRHDDRHPVLQGDARTPGRTSATSGRPAGRCWRG